jgi:hypothetical protein
MTKVLNVDIVKGITTDLCNAVGSQTTRNFGVALVDIITKTLKQRYDFLKYIGYNTDNTEDFVIVDSKINSIEPMLVGRAIEEIIKVICLDLRDKAGLNFINDLEKNINEEIQSDLNDIGVDFTLLKVQQHYLFRQQKRIKSAKGYKYHTATPDKKSLLDYSWDNVSDCVYDANNRTCSLIDKDGNIIDRIDLDKIVDHHLRSLTDNEFSNHFANMREVKKRIGE